MIDPNETDNDSMARLRQALERELGAHESVRWHGWQLGKVDPRHFMIYLFAVPWTAFALMWTLLATSAVGAPGIGLVGLAFPLFGLPFIAVGAWMLSRPFMPLWERGRVLYVVTDSRVLKLALGRALTVKTVPAERIGLAERQESRDGSGTLSLAVKIGRDSDGDRQTERFAVGPVADVLGAQSAVNAIARGGLAASALSS